MGLVLRHERHDTPGSAPAQWITQTAAAKGMQRSALVRNLLELGRGVFEGADRPVSMADVLSALASVRPHDAA